MISVIGSDSSPALSDVLVDRLVDRLVGARPTELLDHQLRVFGLDRRGLRECRVDPILCLHRVAGDLEGDQRSVAVGRDLGVTGQRRDQVLDVGDPGHPLGHVLDRRAEFGIVDGQVVALDQHDLFDRPQPGVIERLLGALGLAGELIEVGELIGADRLARHEGDDRERDEAEDRGLPMLRAPVGRSARDTLFDRASDLSPWLPSEPSPLVGQAEAKQMARQGRASLAKSCCQRSVQRLAGRTYHPFLDMQVM